MQRLLNKTHLTQQAQKRTLGLACRSFASSPQPNTFDKSIKTSLEHGGKKHHFYKLPALADKRLGKHTNPLTSFRNPPLLRPRPSRVGSPQLRRLQCQGKWRWENPGLGQNFSAGRRDSIPPRESHLTRLHVIKITIQFQIRTKKRLN